MYDDFPHEALPWSRKAGDYGVSLVWPPKGMPFFLYPLPRGLSLFLAQTFFLGGTSPQCPRPTGRGHSKCPSYTSLM
jgi:hypothetical protein